MMYPHPGYEHVIGFGLGGLLLFVILWIVFVCFVVGLARRVFWRSGRHEKWKRWHEMRTSGSALDLLNERYVKGEINKEEYEQKKKDITAP